VRRPDITVVAIERIFPLEFESRKPILFYPSEVEQVTGDILEIGPGRGDLFLWLAAAHPEKRFVAIEIMMKRYGKLITRVEKRGLSNIQMLRGNARVAIPRHFKTPCFERVYVLFPDPWPKPRHTHQRLLSIEFLGQLSGLLRESGDIVLATDWQPYADWVIGNVAAVPSLRNTGTPYAQEGNFNPSGEPTFFEKLWRSKGRDIFFVRIERV
jgi:tRNA (guanine-N7-)-methyltransferase